MVSFFTFILLLLTATFVLLQNGLYIDAITTQNIKIKQLYIKWNEKIDVSLQEISINKNNSSKSSKFEYKNIDNYLKSLSRSSDLFSSVTVEKIKFNDVSASFKYREGEDGFLMASSPLFKLESSLNIKRNFLNMRITTLKYLKRNIQLSGDMYFNFKDIVVYGNINVDVNSDVNANLFLAIDEERLIYKLKNNKNIKSINYLINTLNLPKEVKFWALDAIDMDYLSVENVSGFIDFNKSNQILKNIKVKATVHSLNYTYNKKLDAIHAKTTELELKNGVFYIYPKNAYSYGTYLNKSWIKIDFTKKEETLTLQLLFDGMLNKDTLKILNAYKIKLPFLQNSGTVATNLTLNIGLETISIVANGEFFTKKANFDYLGLNIDVYDALIKLKNYDVSIDNMLAKYGNIATSRVDLRYNASAAQGKVIFNADTVNLNDIASLNQKLLKIVYDISPKNDMIHIEKSMWKKDEITLKIDAISIPFDLERLLLQVPTTYFEVKDVSAGFIEGVVNLKDLTASFNTDVLALSYSNVKLNQSNTQINITYDKKLNISSKNKISINVNDLDIDFRNFNLELNHDAYKIKDTFVSIDNLLSTKLDFNYDVKTKENQIILSKLNIKKDDKTIFTKSTLKLETILAENSTTVTSNELDVKFINNGDGWNLKANSLSKLAEDSQFLQDLNMTQGDISVSKNINKKAINFKANVNYPYKVLIVDEKPIENYKISGQLIDKNMHLNVQNKIDMTINEDINVYIHDCGINIPQIRNFFNDINISSDKNGTSKTILNSKNIYFDLGSNRKIISDTIQLQYVNSILTAQLIHKNGTAGLKLNDDKFHLYGSNFNDEFMEKISSLSKFKGGTLDFSVNGKLEDYNGVFYINDTTVLDYKVLNNVLAFVNTIPSLVTFSLPGYSKNGLKVKTSYGKFNVKDGLFNVSDFVIDSKEIDIFGKGVASIKNDTIEATLNLRTDLGSNISKIPLVGYIIFDGDSISTNMSVTGKLSDPDVKSLLAKDIIVAPLNILKRTILLPFQLISNVIGDTNDSK